MVVDFSLGVDLRFWAKSTSTEIYLLSTSISVLFADVDLELRSICFTLENRRSMNLGFEGLFAVYLDLQ